MGKPFKKELTSISQVYEWACNLDISNLKKEVDELQKNPILVIGSGGSLSACYFASKLHQSNGQIGKAITPLELLYSKNIINKCSLLFLSASGRNVDILTSFKNSIIEDPKKVSGITLSLNTPLNKLCLQMGANPIIEFENPIGKDGFLATNSLIAFFVLLHRAYGKKLEKKDIIVTDVFLNEINEFILKVSYEFTFQVLYADWSLPVAIDIESKFSEAALGDVLLSDYRNFGHGRHNWIDKRKAKTAIVALITPDDDELAEKTLALIPKDVPVLRLKTDNDSSLGSIEMLIKSFYLTSAMGVLQNIDPGRPGVPDYGSKLYHLNYYKLLKKNDNNSERVAIQRKLGNQSYFSLEETQKKIWSESYNAYRQKLNNEKYNAIIFDYDGTLCHAVDRYNGLNSEMGNILNQLLEKNITIGIATGRGKSIKVDLRKVVDKKYWNFVVIGYYNGGEIGLLDEDEIPSKIVSKNEVLELLSEKLNERYKEYIKIKLKSKQLTVELQNDATEEFITEIIKFVDLQNQVGILCVQSDHSLDIIIRPAVSKLNVLKFVQNKNTSNNHKILCLGDKGKYPGNDFELLSHDFSLSVDEVSADKNSCWNLANPTVKSTDSTLFYLNRIRIFNDYFKISI